MESRLLPSEWAAGHGPLEGLGDPSPLPASPSQSLRRPSAITVPPVPATALPDLLSGAGGNAASGSEVA